MSGPQPFRLKKVSLDAPLPIFRPQTKRREPMQGRVRIGQYSGLRKSMRAARRGLLPPERLVKIETAQMMADARLYGKSAIAAGRSWRTA